MSATFDDNDDATSLPVEHNTTAGNGRNDTGGGFVLAIVAAPGHEVIGVSVDPPQQQEKVIYYAISRPLSQKSVRGLSLSIQDTISLGCEEKTTIHVFNFNLDTGISFPRRRGRFEIQKLRNKTTDTRIKKFVLLCFFFMTRIIKQKRKSLN